MSDEPRCDHCDRTITRGTICELCIVTGHALRGKCETCRTEAMETVIRLEGVRRENFA